MAEVDFGQSGWNPALNIPRGAISGVTSVNKFGRNTDVDTATDPEDVWDGGGVWVAPTAARVHQIVSTDAGDASAGVGARTIEVFGLTSWTTKETSEVITMNGITNVATTNSYVIIHRMRVLTKGATNVNVGTITATADTDATVTAQINPGQGQTQMAVYGMPSNQDGYLTNYYISFNKAGGASGSADVSFKANPEPQNELINFVVKHTQSVNDAGSSYISHNFNPYNKLSGPCIFKMTVDTVSANDGDNSAGFDMILVDD